MPPIPPEVWELLIKLLLEALEESLADRPRTDVISNILRRVVRLHFLRTVRRAVLKDFGLDQWKAYRAQIGAIIMPDLNEEAAEGLVELAE